MSKWKQGITNKIKSTKIEEKCEFDEYGNQISCHFVPVYTFDHKFAPKCAAPTMVKNRNLYYALRKILKCSTRSKNAEKKKIKDRHLKFVLKEVLKEKNKNKARYENTLEYQLQHQHTRKQDDNVFEDEDISNDISEIVINKFK